MTLGPVRVAHRFDEAALLRWLEANVPGLRGPLEAQHFEGGQSNPTFLLTVPDRKLVLRKKPPGKLLPPRFMPFGVSPRIATLPFSMTASRRPRWSPLPLTNTRLQRWLPAES